MTFLHVGCPRAAEEVREEQSGWMGSRVEELRAEDGGDKHDSVCSALRRHVAPLLDGKILDLMWRQAESHQGGSVQGRPSLYTASTQQQLLLLQALHPAPLSLSYK